MHIITEFSVLPFYNLDNYFFLLTKVQDMINEIYDDNLIL